MERCGDCMCYGIGLCPMGEKWGEPNAPALERCFVPDPHAAERRTPWKPSRRGGSRTPARGGLTLEKKGVRP